MELGFHETTVLYRSENYTRLSCAEALSWIFNRLSFLQTKVLLWLYGHAFKSRNSTTVSLDNSLRQVCKILHYAFRLGRSRSILLYRVCNQCGTFVFVYIASAVDKRHKII